MDTRKIILGLLLVFASVTCLAVSQPVVNDSSRHDISMGGGMVLPDEAACEAVQAADLSLPQFIYHQVSLLCSAPAHVAIDDLDGDGDLDFAVARYSHTTPLLPPMWFEQTSPFAFSAHSLPATLSKSHAMASGDLDGDGDKDLVTAENDGAGGTNRIVVFYNDGAGTFTPCTIAAIPENECYYIAIQDLDGDGAPDLACVAGGVFIMRNLGGGAFTRINVDMTHIGTRILRIADLDNDGRPDIVSADYGRGNLYVYRNTGSMTFARTLVACRSTLRDVSVGDLDNDGDADLLCSSYSGSPSIFACENMGDGTFTFHAIDTISDPGAPPDIADINNDGRLDFATIGGSQCTHYLYYNTGDFAFARCALTNLNWSICLRTCDIDRDGDVDLLFAGNTANEIGIWEQNSGVERPPLEIVTASLPDGAAGAPYSAQLEAAGGAPSYAWSVAAGALPPGIALAADGLLAGTATATGLFVFAAQVADAEAATAQKQLALTVSGQPEGGLRIVTEVMPDAFLDHEYNAKVLAEGGRRPYRWSIVEGTLPPDIILNDESGLLYGKPRMVTNMTFVIRVTDHDNATAIKALTLCVLDPEHLPAGMTMSSMGGVSYGQFMINWRTHAAGRHNVDKLWLRMNVGVPKDFVCTTTTALSITVGTYALQADAWTVSVNGGYAEWRANARRADGTPGVRMVMRVIDTADGRICAIHFVVRQADLSTALDAPDESVANSRLLVPVQVLMGDSGAATTLNMRYDAVKEWKARGTYPPLPDRGGRATAPLRLRPLGQ